MKNTTLLIMAAGIGSRFGGGKESPNEGMEPEVQEDTSLQDSLNDELAKTGNSNDEEESELMGLFKNMVI